MPLTIVQTVAPSAEPISLPEAKAHVRQDQADDDGSLTALIVAARDWVENFTGRQLITATWRLSLDGFPRELRLPRPRLIDVSSLVYDASDGTETTLAPASYRIDADSEPARIQPAYGESWPTTLCQSNAVRITYTAGYGNAAAVPQAIKQAMLLLISHWYEFREPVVQGAVQHLPLAVESLLRPYQSHWEF